MATPETVDGLTAPTLTSGELEATFVPSAGMVGCSLRHHGEEVLGQRGGLRRYVTERGTMGIPLLYPFANRLASRRFPVAGREVVLEPGGAPGTMDHNGLPMHGLLAADPGWVVRHEPASGAGASIVAVLDFAAREDLMNAYPFPHEVRLEASLAGSTLTITTTVTPTGDTAVPVSFGFHPYLRLPGVDRGAWEVSIPVRERLVLDERMLPTGAREPVRIPAGPLGTRTFDDAYVAPPADEPFVLQADGRRIEMAFDRCYRYAQVFAPAIDDVVAFEPMTAPTNALVDGGPELPVVAPGEFFRATFSVTVTAT
jgi:aldose 1-epimerase